MTRAFVVGRRWSTTASNGSLVDWLLTDVHAVGRVAPSRCAAPSSPAGRTSLKAPGIRVGLASGCVSLKAAKGHPDHVSADRWTDRHGDVAQAQGSTRRTYGRPDAIEQFVKHSAVRVVLPGLRLVRAAGGPKWLATACINWTCRSGRTVSIVRFPFSEYARVMAEKCAGTLSLPGRISQLSP